MTLRFTYHLITQFRSLQDFYVVISESVPTTPCLFV